ncbi:hypothetical protein [Lactiplantibacillus fabifermentans]|uniref:Uncharacterized protein n=1 Tax=Lactiplantibacillus fabifermentans T30PCM01 TaxID=1400520 RepID=W6TC31_9LACO|nr:hypothetical protein [Lactiplantibacillus fabifermentans]ETY73680.1 hypothetical protein LFAB_11380 [Lactiplantibacillus fabifermentans T30PCM01]
MVSKTVTAQVNRTVPKPKNVVNYLAAGLTVVIVAASLIAGGSVATSSNSHFAQALTTVTAQR